MAIFTFAAPDGKEYDIEAPEGATQDQALDYLVSNWDTLKDMPSPSDAAKVNEPVAQTNQPVAEQPESESGDFSRGFQTAYKQLPQLGYGLEAGALAAGESILGEGGKLTELKKEAVSKYEQAGKELETISKPTDSPTYSFEKAMEGDYGSLVDTLQYGLGYGAGQISQGGIASLGGKLVGKVVARATAENIAEKMVAEEAAKLSAQTGAEALTQEQLKAAATQSVANKMGDVGSKIAIGSQAFGMEAGEIGGELAKQSVDENRTLTNEEVVKGLGSAIAATALEYGADRFTLGALMGRGSLSDVGQYTTGVKGKLARGAALGASAGGVEFGTEFFQSGIEQYGQGKDILSNDSLREDIDSAILGSIGGGAAGVAGGMLSSAKQKPDTVNPEGRPIAESMLQGGLPTSEPTQPQAEEPVSDTLRAYTNIFRDENLNPVPPVPPVQTVDTTIPIVDNETIANDVIGAGNLDEAIGTFTNIVEANNFGHDTTRAQAQDEADIQAATPVVEPPVIEPPAPKPDKLDATQESLDFIGQAVAQGGAELKGGMLYLPTGEKYSLNKAQRDHYTNLVTSSVEIDNDEAMYDNDARNAAEKRASKYDYLADREAENGELTIESTELKLRAMALLTRALGLVEVDNYGNKLKSDEAPLGFNQSREDFEAGLEKLKNDQLKKVNFYIQKYKSILNKNFDIPTYQKEIERQLDEKTSERLTAYDDFYKNKAIEERIIKNAEQAKLNNEKTSKRGHFKTISTYGISTLDNGNYDISVKRLYDGSVVIIDDNGTYIEAANADFAKGKTDEEILAYHYEPEGFTGAILKDKIEKDDDGNVISKEASSAKPPTAEMPTAEMPTAGTPVTTYYNEPNGKYYGDVKEVTKIMPQELKPLNQIELNWAISSQKASGKSEEEWAKSVDLSEPIKATIYSDGEIKIQDGHHRYLAAKILNEPLNVELKSINAKNQILNDAINRINKDVSQATVAETPTAETPTDKTDYQNMTLDEYKASHPKPYRVGNWILKTDITKMSDADVLQQFNHEDLKTLATIAGASTSGTKTDLLNKVRTIQQNREMLKDKTSEELQGLSVKQLREMAQPLGVNKSYINKPQLIEQILKWRENSITGSQNKVAEFNQASDVVKSVQAGNEDISKLNIKRFADYLLPHVTAKTHPDLYPKVIDAVAESSFTAPFNQTPYKVDSYRNASTRATNPDEAKKNKDIADALEQKYQNTNFTTPKSVTPKVETKLESKLLNGEISQNEYGTANGLTEEEILDRRLFDKVSVPKTTYQLLIEDMQDVVEKKLSTLKRPSNGAASVQKLYTEAKSKHERTLDLLNRFSKSFEHPFRNNLYDKLPDYLKTRFLNKFDKITTGEKAKEEFFKARTRAENEDLISYVKSKQAPVTEQTPVTEQAPTTVQPIAKKKPAANNLRALTGLEPIETAIGKLGGINREMADMAGFSDFKGWYFTKKSSEGFDGMALRLADRGYDVDGENDLIAKLDQSLNAKLFGRGQQVYTFQGLEHQLALEQAEEYKAFEAEQKELAKELSKVASGNPDIIEEIKAAETPEDFDQLLTNIVTLSEDEADDFWNSIGEENADQTTKDASIATIKENAPEILDTYTEQEVRQREEVQKLADKEQAAKDAKAEEKRKADLEFDTVFDEARGVGMTATQDLFTPERKPKDSTVLYEGKGGKVYDEESIQRRNLTITKTGMADVTNAEIGGMFDKYLLEDAQRSFDEDGNYIRDYKYKFISKSGNRGIYVFNDLEEAKAFADQYNQPKGEARKRIGKNQRGNILYENDQGIRSYTDNSIKVKEQIGKARNDVFKTVDELEQKTKPSGNTIFTDDAAEKARAILKSKLGQLNSGLDPELINAGITLAGWHIEKGARTFSAYAKAMIDDMGTGVKPYLKSWYLAVKFDPRASDFENMDDVSIVDKADIETITAQPTKETENVPSTDKRVERYISNANAIDERDEQPIYDEADTDARIFGQTSEPVGSRGNIANSDSSDSISTALTGGEQSDNELYTGNETGQPTTSSARNLDNRRSGNDSLKGMDVRREGSNPIKQLPSKAIKGATPQRVEIKTADIGNIKQEMPFLDDGQVSDVAFAEKRFEKEKGVLFTNGTGTGKTFTGLGIMRRFVDQGKDNIIVIAPSQNILDSWIKAAKKFFKIDITLLKDKTDAGKGVVGTTYANFGDNDVLADRDWDLIVTDEAQYLMQNEQGDVTNALNQLRALTHHNLGFSFWFNSKNRELITELEKVKAPEYLDKFTIWDFKSQTPKFKDASPYSAEVKIAYQDEIDNRKQYKDDKYSEYDKKRTQAKLDWDKMEDNTKVVLLSATPFAHESNIDYAEGYLFTYGDQEANGYNSGGAKEKYFMQHLGYRMRYNKLTQPDAKVDRSNMQRQFNETLKKSGAVSARTLNVDYDYDRRFILTESAVGQRIDEALQWLADNNARDLADILNKRFGGLERRFLLEAIKAKEVVPIIRDYLAAGKKVIVFHDYKVGGVKNPFGAQGMDYTEDAVQQQYRKFQEKFPDLTSGEALAGSMVTPIERFKKEFGDDVMIYNGDSKTRIADVAKFNDDNSGKNLMLLQSASAKEGVSFHDTTGKHQRVLINIGLPTAPTTAIQQEGRIFRVGQKSDAIFRYINTGTNWERWAFASTIAGRASAAENLALGEFARGLRDAFIDAFELSGSYPVGHEGEGKGGKEKDRAAARAVTEMDKARSYYYAQQQKNARTKSAEGTDYFATPEPVGLVMTRLADAKEGEKMLEPSAGHGAIARWFRPDAERTAIEPSAELNSRLALVFQDGDIKRQKFEDLNIINKYDAIVMNPPFGTAGKTAINHVVKAFSHLREGGRIVTLIPEGQAIKRLDEFLYGNDAKGKQINPDAHLIMNINLPDVTFKRAGTGVRTRIVVIEKSSTGNVPQARNLDLSNIDNIEDLFTRMDNIEVMPRMVTNEQPFGADVETTLNEQAKKGKTAKPKRDTSVTDPDAVIDYITKKGKAIKIKLRSDLTHDQAREIDKYTWSFTNPANGEKGFAIHEQYWKDLPPIVGKEKVLESLSIEPKENVLENLTRYPSNYEKEVSEETRINARQRLIKLEKQLEAGKITPEGYRLGVQNVIDTMESARIKQQSKVITSANRRRGADWIVSQMRRGVADKYFEKSEADFAQWLLDQNPHLADNLGFSVTAKNGAGTGGTYNPLSQVIQLFVNNSNAGTAVHEILHHTERMMPEDVRKAIVKAWEKALADEFKNTQDAKLVRALNNMLVASMGNPDAKRTMMADFKDGTLSVEKHYQLYNPSEFWAVNGTRILEQRFEAKNSWEKRAMQWMKEFAQKIKDLLGLKSDNAVLKAFESVANGNGKFVSEGMIQDIAGIPTGGLLADIAQNEENLFNLPAETKFQFMRKWIQDDLLRIRIVMDKIREQGGKVDESNDVVLAMEAAGNIAANQLENLKERFIQPLIDRMAKMNVNKDEIGLLLYAKHAPERNAYIQSINPKFRKLGEGGSGMTDKESAAIIERYKETMGDKYPEFEKLVDDWQNIQNIVKRILVQSGDISPEQAQSWDDGFDYHVPLKGFEEVDEITGKATKKSSNGNIGQGFSISGKFDRRALGRQSRANQIVENIVMNLERAVIRSSKMYTQSVLYKLIEDNPDANLWETEVTPMKPIMGKAKAQYVMYFHGSEIGQRDTLRDARRYVEAETARTGQSKREYEIIKVGGEPQVTLMKKPYDQNEEISYWRNGKQVRITVNDPEFVQAFNRLGDENIYSMFKVMGAFNRFLRHAYTILNPVFIIANGVMVDPAVALYTNTARKGFKYASTVLANTPMASLQLAKYMAKGTSGNAQWDNTIKSYLDNGGKSGTAFISSIEQKADELNLAVLKSKMMDTKFYEYPLDKLKLMLVDNKLANLMKYLGDVGETATRLSTFKVAVDKGMSPQEAAKVARNVTINFNRRGIVGRELGAMYLFLNASIQGTENLIDATIRGEHKAQATAILSSYVALGYLLALLGGDDGDDDLIPEEEKNRYVSIVLDKETGLRVNWKLAYGLSFFKDVGTAIHRIQAGGDVEKITNKLMSSFFGNFAYVNPMVSGEWDAKDLIAGMIPTFGRIPYSVINNRNQWGKPIYPEDVYNTTVPDSEKEWSTTRGTMYSDFAKWMNKVTGGTKVESGLVDISPETMKYLTNALTGSAGTQVYKFVNSIYTSSMNAEEMGLHNLPVVSGFVKENTIDSYRNVYNSQHKEAKDIYDKFKKYEKLGDDEATDKFTSKHQPTLDFYDETKSIIKEVKDLRDKQDEARVEGDKALVKELEAEEKQLLIEYSYQYNQRQ